MSCNDHHFLNETQLKMKIIFCEISEVSSGLALNDLIGIDNFYINPYWQIMENSSRNFPKIFIFWVVTQAVLLENSSIKNHD